MMTIVQLSQLPPKNKKTVSVDDTAIIFEYYTEDDLRGYAMAEVAKDRQRQQELFKPVGYASKQEILTYAKKFTVHDIEPLGVPSVAVYTIDQIDEMRGKA